jgi:hypothetical protein
MKQFVPLLTPHEFLSCFWLSGAGCYVPAWCARCGFHVSNELHIWPTARTLDA